MHTEGKHHERNTIQTHGAMRATVCRHIWQQHKVSVIRDGKYAQYHQHITIWATEPRKRSSRLHIICQDGLVAYTIEIDGAVVWDSRTVFPIYPNAEIAQDEACRGEHHAILMSGESEEEIHRRVREHIAANRQHRFASEVTPIQHERTTNHIHRGCRAIYRLVPRERHRGRATDPFRLGLFGQRCVAQ